MADANGYNPGDPGYDESTEQGNGAPPPPSGTAADIPGTPTGTQRGGETRSPGSESNTGVFNGGGNLSDPNYARLLVAHYAAMPGSDPSLKNNPNYWIQKITSGELGGDESYIINKMQTAWKDPVGGNTGVGQFAGLQRPESVASPYNPATWGETYKVPSVSDLTNDPGYQADEASVQRGLERGAAAKGTLLSGGFIGRAEPRAMADFTSTAYKNLNDRNFANYQQRYGQFLDQNNQAFGARQLNENSYNQDVTNNLNQYLTRYGAYQDLIKNNLSYANLGLNATTAGAPK